MSALTNGISHLADIHFTTVYKKGKAAAFPFGRYMSSRVYTISERFQKMNTSVLLTTIKRKSDSC